MSELRKAVIKNADMAEDMQQVCLVDSTRLSFRPEFGLFSTPRRREFGVFRALCSPRAPSPMPARVDCSLPTLPPLLYHFDFLPHLEHRTDFILSLFSRPATRLSFRMPSTAQLRHLRSTTSRRMLPPTSRRSSIRSITRLGTIRSSIGLPARLGVIIPASSIDCSNLRPLSLDKLTHPSRCTRSLFRSIDQALHCRPQLWLVCDARD